MCLSSAVPSLCAVVLDPGVVNDATLQLLRKHDLIHVLARETRRPGRPVKTLPFLDLANKAITDAGIKALNGINSIEQLYLGGTQITDAGLKEIAAIPTLHTLRLDGTAVTDAGLADLAKFPALAELTLRRTRITDAGLKALAGNKTIKRIELDPQQISDATLRNLRAIDRLHLLDVMRSSAVRARSLADVRGVILTGTQVTDEGLKELAGANLEFINVRNSKVTAAGIAELTKMWPKLKVLT